MDVEWVRELDLYDPSEAAAFEEVAEAIGYREVTEEPLAVLSRFDADEVGLGLLARAQVLAADDERYDEEPLVNLMDGSIHPETLRRIEETSEHDGYAIRHVPGSNVNSLAKDYLHESDFFRVVNPVRAEYTFRDKEFFFDSVYRSGLPVLPSADIAGVIAYEGKYLDEGPIAADRHVIKPGDRAGGTGGATSAPSPARPIRGPAGPGATPDSAPWPRRSATAASTVSASITRTGYPGERPRSTVCRSGPAGRNPPNREGR